MLLAAKTLALTALDLLTKPNILKAAQDEFKKVTDGKKYISPLPKDLKPPIETLE
jgi:aminobenzoyl-glutamate utilization protein B